ncbi:MAG: hypothetical protein ISN26_00305 [Betaproteobacteria bacterium AqS2]|uniref:ATP-binding protein n=1 Tax=Candidatus Amphirhobacter heronislandensis TaxID=1732024 RepID=A0A930UBH9_9GAMM|nr:hypothetical protein [Betaproteobacteria bacterium AqS2]
MSKPRRQANPFGPDGEAEAARLAGRDAELAEIGFALRSIALSDGEGRERKPIARWPIRLHGPPGSGKTALLEAARRTAEEHGIHVVSVTSMPDLALDGQLVSGMIAGMGMAAFPWNLFIKLARYQKKRRRPGEGVGVYYAPLDRVMDVCLQKRPTALLLDHVPGYDVQSLRAFLLDYDWRLLDNFPMALLLAGTPEIWRTLNDTDVGLMDRSRIFDLATLAPAAAREALNKPFEEQGVKVRDEALELMASMADGYPQFIQIVGHEVWEAWAAAGRDEVDVEDVSGAKDGIRQKRERFYQDICGRIKTGGLVEHARHAMELLDRNGGRVWKHTIVESIAGGFAEDGDRKAVDIYYELLDLGFIWSKDMDVEAGIPGLFDYCDRNNRRRAGLSAGEGRKERR